MKQTDLNEKIYTHYFGDTKLENILPNHNECICGHPFGKPRDIIRKNNIISYTFKCTFCQETISFTRG
jgi:hypothetical protein